MRRFWKSQRGFTLADMLVGLGILGVVTGSLGGAIFQTKTTNQVVVEDGIAINEVRKSLGWVSSDVKMAQATDLVDSAPGVSSLTLTWTDQYADAATDHTSTYAIVGTDLVRTYDGVAHTVARRVLSVSFTLSGSTVTTLVTVDAGEGNTRTLTVKTVMRSV